VFLQGRQTIPTTIYTGSYLSPNYKGVISQIILRSYWHSHVPDLHKPCRFAVTQGRSNVSSIYSAALNAGPHRLNRGGNRQLNAALHRIALTQSRCHPGTAALLQRHRQDKHKTRKASLRVLKRHLSDVIYRALNADDWRLGQPARHAA
jgi:hypothetical protein